ncbi:unnamed protein product, partial [Symbiodinium necroappetens]
AWRVGPNCEERQGPHDQGVWPSIWMAVCGIRLWPNCAEKALRFMSRGLAVE